MVTKPDIHDVDRNLAAFAQNMNLDVKLLWCHGDCEHASSTRIARAVICDVHVNYRNAS